MIPYFEWRTIALGPLTIQVWGLFAALGLLLAVWYGLRLAARRGLDVKAFERAAFAAVLWSWIGARLGHALLYEPAHFLQYPLDILKIWQGGFSSFGGFFGGAAGFAWSILRSHLPLLRAADVAAVALPLGMGCGRIGCFLIHDHPGTLAYGAGKWLAVNFPDGPRYDHGLLLGLLDFALFGLLVALARKPRPDGTLLAALLLCYAPARFFLDFFRVVDARYFGLTPAQFGSIGLFAAGFFVMLKRVRQEPRSVSHA